MKKNKVIRFAFSLYIILTLIITLLPMNLSFRIDIGNINYNLIPFDFLIQRIEVLRQIYISGYDVRNYLLPSVEIIFKSFGYNVLLFLPLGFLLPILDKNKYTLKKAMLISFIFSVSIELMQLVIMTITSTNNRCFDVDDIIANTLGGIVGFVVLKLFIFILSNISYKTYVNK